MAFQRLFKVVRFLLQRFAFRFQVRPTLLQYFRTQLGIVRNAANLIENRRFDLYGRE